MMEKLKAHYMKFGPRNCVVATVVILLILDILNTIYLRLFWLKKDLSTTLVFQSIRRSELLVEDFSRDTIMEMTGFLNNTFYFFLFLILANNLFFYFFYLRKKLWAQGYVLFYTLTAAIFSVTFLIDDADLGWGWTLYNLSTFFIYLYLYFGVKLLKQETTDFIPEYGKKAQ